MGRCPSSMTLAEVWDVCLIDAHRSTAIGAAEATIIASLLFFLLARMLRRSASL